MIILSVAAAVVLAGVLAVYLVDAGNLLGLSDRLQESGLEIGVLYYYLYRDGGPIELVQWSFLALMTLTAAYQSGRWSQKKDVARFWISGALLGMLMLMEDMGNVRHLLADIAAQLLPVPDWLARTVVETGFYLLIASPAVVTALLYRRVPASVRPPGKLLVPGAVLYAVAATASASRAVNDWYVMAGHRIHTSAFSGRLPLMPDGFWGVEVGGDVTAFLLMDFLVEESIELLGAGFVLAATVGAIVRYQAREQDSHRRHRNGNSTPGCA